MYLIMWFTFICAFVFTVKRRINQSIYKLNQWLHTLIFPNTIQLTVGVHIPSQFGEGVRKKRDVLLGYQPLRIFIHYHESVFLEWVVDYSIETVTTTVLYNYCCFVIAQYSDSTTFKEADFRYLLISNLFQCNTW